MSPALRINLSLLLARAERASLQVQDLDAARAALQMAQARARRAQQEAQADLAAAEIEAGIVDPVRPSWWI